MGVETRESEVSTLGCNNEWICGTVRKRSQTTGARVCYYMLSRMLCIPVHDDVGVINN